METVSRARGTAPERLRRRLAGDLDVSAMKALRKEPERRPWRKDHGFVGDLLLPYGRLLLEQERYVEAEERLRESARIAGVY